MAARGLRWPRFLSASRPAEAGEQGAAPASGGATRGRARRQGPGGRGGSVRRSLGFLRAASPPRPPSRPPLAASGRSREAETSRGRDAGPASPHFLSENGARRWRGRRLRRPRRSGSCCLPAGWGARRSFPRRRARASGDSRLGGDRVSNRDPVRVSGPAGSPDLRCEIR